MSAPDYNTILRKAGVSLGNLSLSDQTRLINALSAAYTQGYNAGYGVAYSNVSP